MYGGIVDGLPGDDDLTGGAFVLGQQVTDPDGLQAGCVQVGVRFEAFPLYEEFLALLAHVHGFSGCFLRGAGRGIVVFSSVLL